MDVESVADTSFTVVCDTGCGAGGVVLPHLLERMGCKVITLNAQLDGH
ncbi:phosphoglucosamine mutase, partial [Methanosarcinales archaeon]